MQETPLTWLPVEFNGPFPDTELAFTDPDGLLAAGANLEPDTLLLAYRNGIFPWYSDDQPILWWSPDPRCVIFPEKLHISRSLRRRLNKQPFSIRYNTAFRQVMLECAAPRPGQNADNSGTWITRDMVEAYCRLHQAGFAHSIECWNRDRLVGGIYGVKIGGVFFGESMFSREKDASKIAMFYLFQQHRPRLLDTQLYSTHLESLGAENIARKEFINLLKTHC